MIGGIAMDRLILNGSMRANAEKIAVFRAQFKTTFPTLPDFCPDCDYSHPNKLWFRRAYLTVCYRCGYKLKPADYWLSEFDFESNLIATFEN